MAGLYVHIPFCAQLCSYCDFHFSLSITKVDDMIDAMCKEMCARKDYLCSEEIETLYIGGGTPSILSIEQLNKIIKSAQEAYNFNVKELAEFTIECNPEDLSYSYLCGLKEIGCNRLSIGIQSLDDKILKFINRRHNADRALQAVRDAQNMGFTNISIDIIFGIPGLANDILIDTLRKCISLNVQHISAYHLTIESKSVFGWMGRNGKLVAIDDRGSQEQYEIIHKTLTDAGFYHYEVSNYARIGKESIHNSNYWRGVKYIGIGPSAHSFNGHSREWNINGNIRYIEGIISKNRVYEIELLSDTDCYNEYIMTGLRRAKGININHIKNKWGNDFYNYFKSESLKLVNRGLLEVMDDEYKIASSDFLISDMVIAELIKV